MAQTAHFLSSENYFNPELGQCRNSVGNSAKKMVLANLESLLAQWG